MSNVKSGKLVNSNRFLSVIALICGSHFINDTIQSLLPSIYPILQQGYSLTFFQIGCITACYQITGSLLQPLIGFYADKHPIPYAVPLSCLFPVLGLLALSSSNKYYMFLLGSACIGLGSAFFHPEASRITRFASGGRYGLAQSIFQIGGNWGTAVGPLIAALLICRQDQLILLLPFPIISMTSSFFIAKWYSKRLKSTHNSSNAKTDNGLSKSTIIRSLFVLIALMFAKYIYLSTFQNYYSLYIIERFHLSVHNAQIILFLFLGGFAMGTILGGPLGDRIGARNVIWFSILGILPFTLALPYVGLVTSSILSIFIGAILASAFPAIVVYAQELVPGKTGTIAGAVYGFAYGIAALSSCLMGCVGDHIGLHNLFIVCSFLPLLGMLAIFLPKVEEKSKIILEK